MGSREGSRTKKLSGRRGRSWFSLITRVYHSWGRRIVLIESRLLISVWKESRMIVYRSDLDRLSMQDRMICGCDGRGVLMRRKFDDANLADLICAVIRGSKLITNGGSRKTKRSR